MIRAVMFDLDGTLHNREASILSFIENQRERLFPHLDKKVYAERFIKLDQGGYVWKDKVYQQMVEEFSLINFCWQELLQDYLSHFPLHAELYPQAITLLNSLKKKGIRMAIISNGYSKFQREVIKSLQIEALFDEIVISEEVGVKKPHPYIFEHTLSRLDVSPDETIYVGDHLKNDIVGAGGVGIYTIWKQPRPVLTTMGDEHVSDLSEVCAAIMKKINPEFCKDQIL
ncbi:HAD family hydrolase [Cytobacillus sp. FSL R7-0696]|uniref:HAD family hydrolase n=1 Tax=Cytobacillus sp. FSL R7-0696 TaxID=2921691 RepID=UPI0030F5C79F